MNESYTLEHIPGIASSLIDSVSSKVLLFYGEMGIGKTTLIKEIVKQLGSEDVVSSPTFSLVNEYHSQTKELIYHFDFYRINDEDEAQDIGVEDYFYSDHWCLIEWPERVKNLLPLNAVAIYLSLNNDGTRSITIK